MTAHQPLTPLQREVLAFERAEWPRTQPGRKVEAIRIWFTGCVPPMTEPRYYQVLNAVLDQPAAEIYDPALVRRLRRIRAQRAVTFGGRRIGATQ